MARQTVSANRLIYRIGLELNVPKPWLGGPMPESDRIVASVVGKLKQPGFVSMSISGQITREDQIRTTAETIKRHFDEHPNLWELLSRSLFDEIDKYAQNEIKHVDKDENERENGSGNSWFI